MDVSEDGTVTGSIDVSKLNEIDPKTDEAKAQIEALKAEAAAGQEPPEPAVEAQEAKKAAPAKTEPKPEAKSHSSSGKE